MHVYYRLLLQQYEFLPDPYICTSARWYGSNVDNTVAQAILSREFNCYYILQV